MQVERNIKKFIDESDVILANRYDKELSKVKGKIYTRDVYFRDYKDVSLWKENIKIIIF